VRLGVGVLHRTQPEQGLHDPGERQQHGADRDGVNGAFRQAPAQDPVEQESGEGKNGDEPELHQSFIEFTSSMFKVARFLNTVRIMASPTAASAAATTITKRLKIWPFTCFNW